MTAPANGAGGEGAALQMIGPSGRISPAAPYALRQGLDLRPVIAVLPFKERADGGADAFGDALAEDISRALSRSRAFTVISHLSCRHYSAQRATLPQVTSALNPRFIITGEVRGEGDRFRASIDLHDAQTMHLLQSREHAGSRAAFFEGALDIALDVTTDASREASSLAGRAARARPLPSLALHELLMAAVGMMHGQDRDQFFRAKTLLDEALERAPNQAILHAWRAKWRVLKFMKGYAENKREEALVARRDSELALEIDQDSALALAFDGFVRSHLCGEMDLAQDRYRMAVEADENDAFAWLLFGTLHAFRDQSAEAVAFTERARKLSPLDPQRYYFDSLSATAYLADHRWEAALDYAERSLRGNRRHPSTLRVRIIALHHLGRYEESRRAVAELMRLEPGLTVSRYLANHPAAEYSTGKLWAETLEAAGIPR